METNWKDTGKEKEFDAECPHPIRLTDMEVKADCVQIWLACRLCEAKTAFLVYCEDVFWYVDDPVEQKKAPEFVDGR